MKDNSVLGYIKTMRKISVVSLLLFFSLSSYAQSGPLDWPEKMIAYYMQNQLAECIYLADQVLANHSSEYTPREARAMAFGAYAYVKKDPKRASQIVSYIYKPLVDDMLADKSKFLSMNREQKKKYIKDYTDSYEVVIALSWFINSNDSSNISKTMDLFNYYHENIFGYRNVYDSSNQSEAVMIATIIRQESHFLKFNKRYDVLLLNLYPELMSLKKDYGTLIDISIFSAVNIFKNEIVEFGFTEQGKQYLEERTNFLLQYNELCLKILGFKSAKNYNKVNWQEIKNALVRNECAIIMYDYNLLSVTSINLMSGIVISPNLDQPIDLSMLMESSSPDAFLEELETKFPNCERFYICPIGKWENKDVAYTNNKAYMKHSLSDLVRYPKSLKYEGGIISIFADIDYGEKNSSQEDFEVPLNDGKKIIKVVKELFGDKVYSLSGKRVKRINFMNVIDDVSVLHVSTHGKYNSVSTGISLKDTIDFYNSFLGNTSLMNFGLALSDYNNDNRNNFVSAKDVKDLIKFTGNQLVYLDACQTGQTKDNVFGVVGLAKAFYFAGARNVISYNTSVKEIIATDFALSFYNELKNNPDATYHDIFYRVKQTIVDKYRGSLLNKDSYGRPDIGIILWE